MSEFVAKCPRCDSDNMTFDLLKESFIFTKYNWQLWFETFCVCRHCNRATIFVLSQKDINETNYLTKNGLLGLKDSVNNYMNNEGFISLKDMASIQPPEYLPENINDIFRKGSVCMSVNCFNAAGTMFRLCIDLSTRAMLPEDNIDGINQKIRRNLGLRLPWLFDHGRLQEALRELSECIKDDGNDGAHEGTLTEKEAEDLLDFTYAMLERIYTEPEKLKLAKERREARRKT